VSVEAYLHTVNELLALYRHFEYHALAVVPNFTTYADSFTITARHRDGGDKMTVTMPASGHRQFLASLHRT